MDIELLPVIEINCYNESVVSPSKGPYWDYETEWDHYHAQCLALAGYPDTFLPYARGSTYYRPDSLSDANLSVLIRSHLADLFESECPREEILAFDGGYVLRVKDNDIYFPQCCSDLSDFGAWQDLLKEEPTFFYAGHPSPAVYKSPHAITFNFLKGAGGEGYGPPPTTNLLELDRKSLAMAIEAAKSELNNLAARLEKINQEENWGIQGIADLLIWGSRD